MPLMQRFGCRAAVEAGVLQKGWDESSIFFSFPFLAPLPPPPHAYTPPILTFVSLSGSSQWDAPRRAEFVEMPVCG